MTEPNIVNEPLRCSIIVNTYNRAPYLKRLLAAFEHLSYSAFEVVVVNGPSTDGTAELLQEYEGRIKIIDCPVANLSASRNLGVAAAAGEIVLFVDDDAWPCSPGWLERYVALFQADPEGQIGAAGGAVLHRGTELYEFKGGATSDYGLQAFYEGERGKLAPDDTPWTKRVVGCNCAFRHAALQEVGGFDEYFRYRYDDADICLRLARQGYLTLHLPDAAVRHYAASSLRRRTKYDQDWTEIARSDTYFALKNSSDRLLKRMLKTLALAPRKQFLDEPWRGLISAEISTWQFTRFIMQWVIGFISGYIDGLFLSRQNRLDWELPLSSFLPFKKNTQENKLRICFLARSWRYSPNLDPATCYINLVEELHKLGHETHIICQDEEPIYYHSLEFTIHGISEAAFSSVKLFPNWPNLNHQVTYSLAVFHKLLDLHRKDITFDIVQGTDGDLDGLAVILSGIYPVVLFLPSPSLATRDGEAWTSAEELQAYIALNRWQIEWPDSVCCPSSEALESYKRIKVGMGRLLPLPERRDAPSLARWILGHYRDVIANTGTECRKRLQEYESFTAQTR